jgi:glycerol-3-phosphate dehydrogenase
VVNAAGPWSRDIAASLDRSEPSLFRPSIAWNMLLSRNALSRCALAITPKKAKAHTYFLLPWKGKLLAGTGHKPWRDSISNAMPPDELMQEFIDDLNCAIPSLQIKQKDILYLFPGLLPAAQDGTATLAVREVILDHASHGGPRGLYSVSGVKFTTARLVAEKALQRIFPARKAKDYIPGQPPVSFRTTSDTSGIFDFNWLPKSGEKKWMDALRPIVQDQSVQHLDDLMFRRTTLWDNPGRVVELAPSLCKLFPWDDSRCAQEIARVKARLYGG